MNHMPPVGRLQHHHPELTDHCLPDGKASFVEHDYTANGRCRRYGASEEWALHARPPRNPSDLPRGPDCGSLGDQEPRQYVYLTEHVGA
ncbi:hypothetical protein ACFRDV_26500 [Streptomyces fagopyri]|uniref:hypothetical protein n=1 Tax=Streptomyces fagopyri TaxID=2662397 RepID=UPI00367712C0